jgi:hypothetical protein
VIDWRHIDTTPKDGRRVLLFDAAQLTPHLQIKVGWWMPVVEGSWDKWMRWRPGSKESWFGLWNPSHWAQITEPETFWK